MKKLDAFKLSLLAASVAGLGMGCASSGYARYDSNDPSMNAGMHASTGSTGASASAEVGSDRDSSVYYSGQDTYIDECAARVTVSALSFSPETRADWVNRFPFYDPNWQLRNVQTYTFAVPDPSLHASADRNLPEFSVNLPPGSVFVESAGGAGAVRTGRVIQHSPNPNR